MRDREHHQKETAKEPLGGCFPHRCRVLTRVILGSLMLMSQGCGRLSVPRAAAQEDRALNVLPDVTPTDAGNNNARQSDSTDSVTVVKWSQESWKPRVDVRDWQSIVIHHTATDAGSVESIHRVHQQRKDAAGHPWRGIGYHFVIGNGLGMDDGAVEATFRWREQLEGAHAGVSRYNLHGVGVCLVGNFELRPPTDAQLTSLKKLIAWLSQEYGIAVQQVLGHGQLKATACPGKMFPMDELIRSGPTASHQSKFFTTHRPQL